MSIDWSSVAAVAQVTDCTPENIDGAVLNSSKPLVLKNFGRNLPLVKAGKESGEQALDYLRQHYAAMPITTCYGAPETKGRVYYNSDMSDFNFHMKRQSLGAFVEEFIRHKDSLAPPTLYIPSTDLAPSLAQENSLGLEYLNPVKSIWVGNRTRVAAHYDFPSNIACCVAGRRRFTLFPPDQIKNLYPGPLHFAPGGQEISLVDFSAPDLERFPRFVQAVAQASIAELEPGDALFLPGMWWHHVEGLEAINVLYTHWWRDSSAAFGRPTNALLHAVMSLRGLSEQQRQAWKQVFDYYIFERDEDDLAAIPAAARGLLNLPLSDTEAAKLRAELLGRLK
jgi:hypothetical protein